LAVTITSAVVHRLIAEFSGGVVTELQFDYSYIDSNGASGNATYRIAPTTAQQTSIDNFVTNMINQIAAATNLTITLN